MRLKKPCAYQGCPELIEKGERYCEVHKKIRDKEYDKYGRSSITPRDTTLIGVESLKHTGNHILCVRNAWRKVEL